MPRVSVIAPVYGVEQYIHQFMESVLAQTYKDFEFIVVDDGSPDNCPRILDEYAETDSRIRVIHQKNGGVAKARNTGIDAATGEYVYIVDSDDWLQTNALEVLIRDADETKADVIMGDCTVQTERGQSRMTQFSQKFYTEDPQTILALQQYVLCQRYSPYYSRKCTSGFAGPWGKMIKLDLINKYHIRFEPYMRGLFDDGLFTLEVYQHMNSFYYGMENLYNYRINDNSLTQKYRPNDIEVLRCGFEKIEEFIHKYNKENDLLTPYYCHVARFLIYRLTSYFFNDNNGKKYFEIRKELLATIKSEPFNTAIKKCRLDLFQRNRQLVLLCLRNRCIIGARIYTYIKRYKQKKQLGIVKT